MSFMPAMRPRAAGFTIVELMFTLFIAAILFAVAVPSFRQMMANNRLATQTNDMIGAANIARSEAITRNANVTLCRAASEAATTCAGSTGTWGFWIVRNTASSDIVRRGAVPTYGGVIVVRSSFTNDTVTFSPDGLARHGSPLALINSQTVTVCTTFNTSFENIRTITMGTGSRVSTARSAGACT